MTLVATLALDNLPVLIGDLLLTRKAHPADLPLALPSGVDTYKGTARTVAGLSRKLALISKRCVLGWSCDDVVTADEVFASIRSLEREGRLSRETIYAAIQAHPRADADRLSVLGWYVEDDVGGMVTAHEIEYEALYGSSNTFSEVRAIGSGARSFFALLAHTDRMQFATKAADANTSQARRLTTIFSLVGWMFAAEHRQGGLARNLELSFGGGYEIATWSNGEFVLVGGYTLSIWSATVDANAVHITYPPPLIARIFYQDEFLIIDSDRLLTSSDDQIDHHRHTFIIAPFADSGRKWQQLPPPHFTHHVHALVVTNNDKAGAYIGAMLEFSGPILESRARLIDLSDGRKGFVCSESFQNELLSYIRMMTTLGT